jgi:tRNA 2-thiouridine synthesizing protein A
MVDQAVSKTLDASGMQCPMPIVKTRKAIRDIDVGQVLEVISTDPGSMPDMQAWARQTQHELLESHDEGGKYRFLIKKTH